VVVNFLQPRRILGIAERNDSRARLHASRILPAPSPATSPWRSIAPKLRASRGFKLGQAGLEHALRSAILFNQLPNPRRPQPRRQSQREPIDTLMRRRIEPATAALDISRSVAIFRDLARGANAVKDGAHITFGRIRKSMSRLKISAISYLNTAPLMWDFEHAAAGAGQVAGLAADLAANYEISYTIPSACAKPCAPNGRYRHHSRAAYTTVPDLVIIPDVAIAAKRAVRSILLVSKKPVDSVSPDSLSLDSLSTAQWATQVRTVALDTSSMTSVALTKFCLPNARRRARL